jgi:hypothetical protein
MEPFCANCLVAVRGRKYCSSCKVMAVGDRMPMVEVATVPCAEADEALKYALIGILCFGPILEPLALFKAIQAKKLIAANPVLSGSGKATAALVISCVILGFYALALLSSILGTSCGSNGADLPRLQRRAADLERPHGELPCARRRLRDPRRARREVIAGVGRVGAGIIDSLAGYVRTRAAACGDERVPYVRGTGGTFGQPLSGLRPRL